MGKSKPVIKIDADGNIVGRYESALIAGDLNGISEAIMWKRCRGEIADHDGCTYRYEEECKPSDHAARRKDAAAARAARERQSRYAEEEQRLATIPGIQRDAALRLLSQGMDVLGVSRVTGLGPERLGYMLHQIRTHQRPNMAMEAINS